MNLSTMMYPVETLYNITQTHMNKQKRYPKLLKFFDTPKQQRIRFSEVEERKEIENDPTVKISDGDQHYFPPKFHYIPEQCKSRTMKHDSPWNENFGNEGKKAPKKKVGCKESEKQKKGSKSKREIFMDVQMGILKCMVPQIGFLCDLEKAKQRRKRCQK